MGRIRPMPSCPNDVSLLIEKLETAGMGRWRNNVPTPSEGTPDKLLRHEDGALGVGMAHVQFGEKQLCHRRCVQEALQDGVHKASIPKVLEAADLRKKSSTVSC